MLSTFYFIGKNIDIPFYLKCIIGMIIITAIELIFGIWFNIILGERVWDYSNMPLNFLGQICVPFSMMWLVLSGIAFKIIEKIHI